MSRYTSVQGVRYRSLFLRNRKTMWQMIRETLTGRYHMSLLTVGIFVFAVVYIIYPNDPIPDRIPVLGWLDDLLVVFLLVWRLVAESHRYVRSKAMDRKG